MINVNNVSSCTKKNNQSINQCWKLKHFRMIRWLIDNPVDGCFLQINFLFWFVHKLISVTDLFISWLIDWYVPAALWGREGRQDADRSGVLGNKAADIVVS